MERWFIQLCTCSLFCYLNVSAENKDEHNVEYWNAIGIEELKASLALKFNTNVAKNVILFIGDGMGIPTITAARTYMGQKLNRSGEESKLSFEKFPYASLIKTYSVSKQVPDSAATATAFLTGVKTRNEMLGLSAKAKVNNCKSAKGNEISSIMKWAQDEGKDTGFITTTRVTHATPAALYAHTVQRDWESNDAIPKNSTECLDIASQLIEKSPGKYAKVIFGGGRKKFLPKHVLDKQSNKFGQRTDGKDLVMEWQRDKVNRIAKYQYVKNLEEFNQINVIDTDYVLGLFNYDHMQYEVERNQSPEGEPSLAQMTEKAISILKKNKEGFFLMVEGGRIDHAHHETKAMKALEDTIAFSDAVSKAVEITNTSDTLIVVTADHSHVMTINGYPDRGNPIFGIAGKSDIDNKSYTTLLYTNGPGYQLIDGERPDPNQQDIYSPNYTQFSAVPLKAETHGGEDIALYAVGPMAHLFHGVHEQNYIAYVMAYASCVGQNKYHCKQQTSDYQTDSSTQTNTIASIVLISLTFPFIFNYF